MTGADAEAAVARLARFYETLSRESLGGIGTVYAEDARFRDPFNDVQGLAAIRAVFDDMFERTRAPRFVVTGTVTQGDQAFLHWDFRFGLGRRELCVQGCSHVHLGADGRVVRHRDYWDVAGELYEQMPLLGVLMRALRRRLSAHPGA